MRFNLCFKDFKSAGEKIKEDLGEKQKGERKKAIIASFWVITLNNFAPLKMSFIYIPEDTTVVVGLEGALQPGVVEEIHLTGRHHSQGIRTMTSKNSFNFFFI